MAPSWWAGEAGRRFEARIRPALDCRRVWYKHCEQTYCSLKGGNMSTEIAGRGGWQCGLWRHRRSSSESWSQSYFFFRPFTTDGTRPPAKSHVAPKAVAKSHDPSVSSPLYSYSASCQRVFHLLAILTAIIVVKKSTSMRQRMIFNFFVSREGGRGRRRHGPSSCRPSLPPHV